MENNFKILIPTDFSDCSIHALEYALELQEHIEADITIFHAIYLPGVSYAVHMDAEIHKVLVDEAAKKLKSISEKYQHRVKGEIFTKTIYNVPAMAVKEFLKEEPHDLIIVGTKGASGLKKVFIGTHASEISETSPIPVLIVPGKTAHKPVKKIVYATDMENLHDEAAEVTAYARMFNAEVDIIKIVSEPDQVPNDNQDVLSQLREETAYEKLDFSYVKSNDVIKGIDDYVTESNADVLAMFYRKKGFLRRMFEKSQTTTMAYSSKVPLLTFRKD